MFNIPFSENRAIYEIMWKKYGIARQATGTIRVQCGTEKVRFAYRITKARIQTKT